MANQRKAGLVKVNFWLESKLFAAFKKKCENKPGKMSGVLKRFIKRSVRTR